MKKSLLTFCLFLGTISLFAQSFREFSSQEAFLTELQDQLVEKTVGDAKKDNKKMLDKFEEMWVELNSFSAGQKEQIYRSCNQQMKAKLKVVPEIRDYIETVIAIVESGQNEDVFAEWHRTVDAVIELRSARKDFVKYMTFSKGLYTDSIIFSSPAVEWRAQNGTFRFELENGEPRLIFPNLWLECRAKGSNAIIKTTSGVFFPLDEKWIGKNGVVTWERAGLDANKVYAIINDYEVNMKYSDYSADSVTFYNTDYFEYPLKGRLEDKVRAAVSEDRASFPMFTSYSKRLSIPNIDKNVDYEGGFAQRGSRFLASGSDEDPASLTFYYNEKAFLKVFSIAFSIKEDQITSNDTRVKFILHEDSITHPGVDFKFFRGPRKVNLYKADEGLQKAPYFDSYHAIDIQTELVTWFIDQPKIGFGTIPNSSDKRATFESDFYFKEARFDQLMGLSMSHPLVQLKNCFESKGIDMVYDTEVASCLGGDKTDAMVLLLQYTNLGFVDYDPETGKAYAKERMYHYVKSKSKQQDYDVIQIKSEPRNGYNAEMNLLDEIFTIKMNGIDNIILSDSHNVALFPDGGTITMGKNRDFDFSGVITAGRLEFFGTNFNFSYSDFKIEMPKVDSVRLSVGTGQKNSRGLERLARVQSIIEHVNGTLEIDHPRNKSGIHMLDQFPIFTSHDTSYVYYKKQSIHDGVYKDDIFYFALDPFVFDSLDQFDNDRLQFTGEFTSADIFPIFRETLNLQEDLSLGFIRQTPSEGYEIYRGKGRFFDEIRLSNKGLRGGGKLKYLNSTTKSDDYLFLPEEMQAIANSFVIEEQMAPVQFPPVTGSSVKQVWSPYDNVLKASSYKEPIKMYDGSEFEGDLFITPEDLTGSGLFTFEQAELESKKFMFKLSEFDSDTADFRLVNTTSNTDELQFKTNNVNAHIDFVARKGEFISNDGTSMMEFPANQYVAFMDRFTWFMDEESIELSGGTSQKTGAGGTMNFEGSRFISMHPEQDSLEFYSAAARYSSKDQIIKARKVEFMQVADALIYPDSGFVTVMRKAKMKTFTNTKIVANAVTRFHQIDSATVDIFARRDYVGTGKYTYTDVSGNKQVLRFNTVAVDSSFQTFGKGDISEERAFTLSPYFEYKGTIRMNAAEKELAFSGYSRMKHVCEAGVPLNWFDFSAKIDPEEVAIPINSTTRDEKGELLFVGMMIDLDTGNLYSSFVTPKIQENDRELLPASGFLVYDNFSKEYRISNIDKLTQRSLPGQYVSLNAEGCKVEGEGKMGFGINPGQISMTTVGNMKQDLTNKDVLIEALLLVDFFFIDKTIDDMGKTIATTAQGDPTDFERDGYEIGMRELIGTEDADRLISSVTLTGQFKKFPSELEKNMFLTDLNLRWNPETDSYQSFGKIGVGNIGKRQVNIKMTGKVEIVVGRIPEINIYLEADKDTWYYFKYSRNVMKAFSSIEDFNTSITELKTDKRKMKVERGEAPYTFMIGSKRLRDDFLAKF
jgi:hypothetical protein